ncbi:MAG: hypothetical protein DSY58_06295 [Desulfobulbus sp.]|nr:MAG: hypothetical protein DSY58_06295 [Desulfobulbus sp.]
MGLKHHGTFLCCLYLLFLVSGCGLLQQKAKIQLPEDLPRSWSDTVCIEKLPVTTPLLELFHDGQLKILVQEALDANPDLKATAYRLRGAGFLIQKTRSKLFPQVNADFTDGRDNQGVDGVTGENQVAHSHKISMGISWEIDIWGRLADEYNASKQDVAAQEQLYLQARDALAARVIQTWIHLIGLKRSVNIEQERLAVFEHIRNVLVKRYRNGLGNPDEISTATGRLKSAQADVSSRNTAFSREKRVMEVLLGRYPAGGFTLRDRLPKVHPPPVHAPATVLLKRPDIQAALAKAASARLLADAAEKARLPELNLSGELFREAATLGNLGKATSYWSVLGSVLQPIFDGGRLKAGARAGHAEFQASLMDLRAAVLQAIKEVEDGFDLERDYKIQVQVLKTAVGESEKSSRYYRERYRQGLDTIQNLFIAKEQEMSVKERLNQAITGRLSNRIELALALGVGLADNLSFGQELQ